MKKTMGIDQLKKMSQFWSVFRGRSRTQNIPLKQGNLNVMTRELGRMDKQSLNLDPDKSVRCLFVEGYVTFKKKRYYIQYINYNNGNVEWHIYSDKGFDSFAASSMEYIGKGKRKNDSFTMGQFEKILIKEVLPDFLHQE